MATFVQQPEGRPDKNLLEQYIFSSSCESGKDKRAEKLTKDQKAQLKKDQRLSRKRSQGL